MKKNKLLKLAGIILCLVMLCGIMAMTASAESNEICLVAFTDLNEPVPEANMDFDATPVSANLYEVAENGRGLFWYDDDLGKTYEWSQYSPPQFVEGREYKVRIYVEPKAGYKFPEKLTNVKAFINDTPASFHKDSNGYFLQTYFDPCGSVENILISCTPPVAGQAPGFDKVENYRYESTGSVSPRVNGVSWYDETAGKHLYKGTGQKFESHHVYTVTFEIESRMYTVQTAQGNDDKYYEFNGKTKAAVNGISAASVDLYENGGAWIWATVKYTFDETGCAPEFVEPQPPSCDKTGHVGYYACSCGKWFWDEAGTEPVTNKEEIVIPPTGAHNETVVGAVASTCTVKGYTGDKVCSVCKKTLEKGVEIALKNHTEVKIAAKAATYKATGLTEGKKCADCGKITVAQKTVARKKLGKVKGIKVKSVKLASGSKSTLTLSWSKVTGAEKYEIQQYVSKKWKTIKTTSKTYCTVTKLKADKSYKFRVRAVAGKYYGSYSSSFTGKTVPPGTTVKLTAGKKLFTASWSAVADITSYEVQYSTSSKFSKKTTKTITVKAKSKKTTIKKLTKGKKYYVKVRAYKTVGKTKVYSAWSAVKSVKVK